MLIEFPKVKYERKKLNSEYTIILLNKTKKLIWLIKMIQL